MNKKEAAIISAYTGIMCGEFYDLQLYAKEKLEATAEFSHFKDDSGDVPGPFAIMMLFEKIKELSKPDFLAICESISDMRRYDHGIGEEPEADRWYHAFSRYNGRYLGPSFVYRTALLKKLQVHTPNSISGEDWGFYFVLVGPISVPVLENFPATCRESLQVGEVTQ
jgi:hypothetical protein